MQFDLRLPPKKTMKFRWMAQRAVKTGRRDFQMIRMANQVFDIEKSTQFPADPFAVVKRNAFRMVDEQAQNPAMPFVPKLGVKKFQTHPRQEGTAEVFHHIKYSLTH